jgi:hypothetical protein
MNFLAAMLLIHVGEASAFYGLVWVVETLLAGYYVQTLEGLQADTAFLTRLLSRHNPSVHEHIEELEISLSMLVTSMLMCVFIEVLPEPCVPPIWDCFLLDGLSRCIRQSQPIAPGVDSSIVAVARQRSRSGTVSSAHGRAQADAATQTLPLASIHLRISLALFDDLQVCGSCLAVLTVDTAMVLVANMSCCQREILETDGATDVMMLFHRERLAQVLPKPTLPPPCRASSIAAYSEF